MKLKNAISLLPVSLSALLVTLSTSCSTDVDQPLSATGQVQGLNSQTAASFYAEAKSLQAAGKNNAAIKAYQTVADKYPLSAQAPEARYQEASILYAQGELLDSFDAYQKFIDKYNSSHLYSSAIQKQSEVALAAAKGEITHNFAGLKSKLAGKNVEEMLTKVRENAPYSTQAPKAQFAIGTVWQDRGDTDKAIAGYRGVQERYPNSSLTPEALYRTGSILMSQASKGNRNKASLDSARNVFLDLQQQYPSHPRAKDAKAKLAELSKSDVQRSFDIAEFYQDKGQSASAAFYYREVIRMSSAGSLREKAQQRLVEIGQ
ncbi:MAG: tetratricopeptide repeat protein [Akkermansiaceae bacterium]